MNLVKYFTNNFFIPQQKQLKSSIPTPFLLQFLHFPPKTLSLYPQFQQLTRLCDSQRPQNRAALRISPHCAADSDPVLKSSKTTILVFEKLDEVGLDLLCTFGNIECLYNLSPKDLCAKIRECDVLIVRSGNKVTSQVFEAAKGRLKVVGRVGVGIDSFH